GRHAAGAQSPLPRPAHRRRLGSPAVAGRDRVRALDREKSTARRDAGNSATVNQYLLALLWAIVGAGGGWLVRRGSVKLARLEGLEPGSKRLQGDGQRILEGVPFAPF